MNSTADPAGVRRLKDEVILPAPGLDTLALSEDQFRSLHASTAPGEERWTEIPWRTDLMAARAEAEKLGRPLLMWIMDGHPLGCT